MLIFEFEVGEYYGDAGGDTVFWSHIPFVLGYVRRMSVDLGLCEYRTSDVSIKHCRKLQQSCTLDSHCVENEKTADRLRIWNDSFDFLMPRGLLNKVSLISRLHSTMGLFIKWLRISDISVDKPHFPEMMTFKVSFQSSKQSSQQRS